MSALLRPAAPEDAAEMLRFLRSTAAETEYLLRTPEEWTLTESEERELLAGALEDPRRTILAGFIQGELAGIGSVNPTGAQRRVRHRCSLALVVRASCWGLGLGRGMLTTLCGLACDMGYMQAELEYVEGNARARSLYERCGFVATGRFPRATRYDDGRCADDIFMVKLLKP